MLRRKILKSMVVLALVFGVFTGTVLAETNWVTANCVGNPDAEIELTLWLERNLSARAPTENQRNKIKERMESWARKNPNVKVNIEINIPGNKINEYMVKLFEAAKAGNAPDFASLDSFWLPRFLASEDMLKQVPQPLDEFLTKEELNNYFEPFREFCTDDEGRLRAHFYYTDIRPLWYRSDLIDTPPKTWSGLIKKAKEIMKEHPEIRAGFLTTAGMYENSAFNLWGTYWAAGGKLVDENGRPVFNEGKNREKMLKLLRLLKKMVDEGVMPSKVVSLASTPDLNAAIVNSNAAFALCGNWHASSLGELIGEEEFAKKWDMASQPAFEGDPNLTGAGGWTLAIFTEDEVKKRLAFDFMWHVYGGFKGMAYATCESLPTFKDIVANYSPIREKKYIYQSAKMLDEARLRPGAPIYPEISRAFQTAMGEVIIGKKTPEEALDGAWKQVMEVYE